MYTDALLLCSVKCFLFVQCWPSIFCVQCCGNLFNGGMALAATDYQKINQSKIKISKNSYCSDNNAPSFSCAMFSGVSWAILQQVFTCAMLFQEYYDNTEQNFFMQNVVWSHFDNIAQGILPMQCWSKSIKTTLNRVFFLCNVVWVSCTTLHKVFSCAMLSQNEWMNEWNEWNHVFFQHKQCTTYNTTTG